MNNHDEWMNYKEAAAFLKISLSSLYAKKSKGQVPYHEPRPQMIRFLKSELVMWLTGETVPKKEQA